MAGISSEALKPKYVENKKKYNGIEFEGDIGIEIYDAQLRELDPQVGKWWQIDPKVESMEMWSPYASNYDNPIRYSDPLGDEGEDCCKTFFDIIVQGGKDVVTFVAGAVNAFSSNQLGGAGRKDPNSFSNPRDAAIAKAGQTTGDILTIGGSVVATGGSIVVEGGSLGLATPAVIPLMAQQWLVAAPTALKNLFSEGESQSSAPSATSTTTHGNKLNDKPAEGYTLRDKKTGTVKKYGETTRGEDKYGTGNQKRYTKKELDGKGLKYKKEESGTKKEMHKWQHDKIIDHKEKNGGKRPDLNKSDY